MAEIREACVSIIPKCTTQGFLMNVANISSPPQVARDGGWVGDLP